MIESSFDKIITTLTVRLKDFLNNDYTGSGVIYYQDNFKDKVYILTASHCLFTDGDQFRNQRNEICIDLLKSNFSLNFLSLLLPVLVMSQMKQCAKCSPIPMP